MSRRQGRVVAYNVLRRRVREHRTTDLLVEIAAANAHLRAVEFGRAEPLDAPNSVQSFALGGVARAALVGGQDRYGKPATLRDLIELCELYFDVEDPALSGPKERLLRASLTHMGYEQIGSQTSVMENIGRTLVLLCDHAATTAGAPTASDWEECLEVSLEHFMRLGFMMYFAAADGGGAIHRDRLRDDEVASILSPATPDEGLAVIDRWFAASPEQLQADGAAEQQRGAEKWSLSPLVAHPIVTLPDGRYLVPWPRLILDRITPTGLYFIGLELFGNGFPGKLGGMFEHYIGTQLGLLKHAEVLGEIRYGKSEKKTVDHFIITPEAVILVEVKAARPIRDTRLGQPTGDEDTADKVGYAYKQIDRTAQLIRDGHRALAAIPSDRPLLGLVVTLEPFHLVNAEIYDDVLKRPSTPTTVASAHELERFVAVLRSSPEVGQRLLNALTGPDSGGAVLGDAIAGLPEATNPLLDEAWDRFSQPWTDP